MRSVGRKMQRQMAIAFLMVILQAGVICGMQLLDNPAAPRPHGHEPGRSTRWAQHRAAAMCNKKAMCLRGNSALAFQSLAFQHSEGFGVLRAPQLAFNGGEVVQGYFSSMGEFFSEGWARTKQGFSLLWHNWGEVREIQGRRHKGEDISLHEWCMVARDKHDTGKVIRGIGVYAMSPSLFPYYLIFWPGALPSTFDLPKHQETRYKTAVSARIHGLLTGLAELEQEGQNEKSEQLAAQAQALKRAGIKALATGNMKEAVLAASSWLYYNASGTDPKSRPRANLEGLPASLVKGATLASGFSIGFLPDFILKFPLKSHLASVIDGDEQLLRPDIAKRVGELSRHDLLDLCLERGLGEAKWPRPRLQLSLEQYSKDISSLQDTLLAHRPSPELQVDPWRLRLAALAVNAAASAREVETGSLTRALYTGSGAAGKSFASATEAKKR